jgi:O-methyltransferase
MKARVLPGGDMKSPFTLKGRILRWLLARRGATLVHMVRPLARRDLEIVRATRACVSLLVDDAAALEILAHARACSRLGGSLAEVGVFAGGTARLICEVKGDAPLHLFDVFESLQTPPLPGDTARATELRRYFAGWHASRAKVELLLAPYPGVHVHAGVFPDSARGFDEQRFSFVHLDLDLESSTRDALEFFFPRLLPGGMILGDDYADAPVRRAFDEYFAGRPDTVVALPWGNGQALAIKT